MVIAHAFLALLAGFATMAIIVVISTALLQRIAPEWVGTQGRPRPAYVFVNLGYSMLAAAAGGYVTAWATGRSPLNSVLALAVVVLVMGAISALQARERQPLWYVLALFVITPLGVVLGGLVRLRVIGVL